MNNETPGGAFAPAAGSAEGRVEKPSRIRQKEDAELVRAALHKNNGAPYSPEINPYLPPLARAPWPLRAERFKRWYTNRRASWLRTDAHFREVCEAYGMSPNDKLSERLGGKASHE